MILAADPAEEAAALEKLSGRPACGLRGDPRCAWTGCPSPCGCSTRRCTSSCRPSRTCGSRGPDRALTTRRRRCSKPRRRGARTTRCWAPAGCGSRCSSPASTRCRCGRSWRRPSSDVAAGGAPVVEVMIPLTVSRRRARAGRGRGSRERSRPPGARGSITIGTMIETPRAALLAGELRRGGRLLLLRHQRPHPDDVRLQPRRRRGPPRPRVPRGRDPAGGQPVRDARRRRGGRARGPGHRAGPGGQARAQGRGVRRARRRPRLDPVLPRPGPRLRVLLAVSGPDCPVGRRTGHPGGRPIQSQPRSP